MKQVKVSTPYFDNADYLLLETEDDVQIYWKSLNEKLQETCGRLLRSDVKPERWYHCPCERKAGYADIRSSIFG